MSDQNDNLHESIEHLVGQTEDYLQQLSANTEDAAYDEYIKQIDIDRTQTIRQLIEAGILRNQSETTLSSLPLLDEQGELSAPYTELYQNRMGLYKEYMSLYNSTRKRTGPSYRSIFDDSSLEDVALNRLMIADLWLQRAQDNFADAMLLELVADYNGGLKPKNRESLKKRDQLRILAETNHDSWQVLSARSRMLRGLDIIVPDGGYSQEELASSEIMSDLAEFLINQSDQEIYQHIKDTLRSLWANGGPNIVPEEAPMRGHHNHDDYLELINLMAMSAADDEGGMYELFIAEIQKLANRIGVDTETWQTELELMFEVAEEIRRNNDMYMPE